MPHCCAYLDDGRICGRPALHVDVQRGGVVCEYHLPPAVHVDVQRGGPRCARCGEPTTARNPHTGEYLCTAHQPHRQLHFTAIDMLSRCGEQYRRRYVQNEKIPPGVAVIVGSATHRCIAGNMRHKMETGALLLAETCAAFARDAVNKTWAEEGVLLNDDERQMDLGKVRGAAVDKAVRLSVLHHQRIAPLVQPTHVERAWTLALPGYPDLDLAGTIDIQEGSTCIRDSKTSAMSPAWNVADNSDQLTAYALAAQVLDGAMPGRLALDYLVDLKRGPKVETRVTTRTADDSRVFLRRVEAAINALDKGAFVPARQTDWWCSLRWCGYASTCPYFRGRTGARKDSDVNE